MSPLISCKNLTLSFSGKTLFSAVDFSIHSGDRVGLIGRNGSGKSTLIQCMTGAHHVDEGEVTRVKGLRYAFISQQPDLLNTPNLQTVGQVIEQRLSKVIVDPEQRGVAAQTWLSKAGFLDAETCVRELSGGWQKRLQIACALAQEADVLFLDEPTNHLDLRGTLWLERCLQEARFAWVLITHDRYFLDRTVKSIAELDPLYPDGLLKISGGYQDFVRRKDAFFESQSKLADSLATKNRREQEWLQRGPKARTTKSRFRIQQANQLQSELAEVRGRLKKNRTSISFDSTPRQTKKLIDIKRLCKSWGENVILQGFDHVLRRGDRLGILGDNGSGKSTLLRLLAGEEQPSSGTIKFADGLQSVYFDQQRESLDSDWTLKRALADGNDAIVYRGKSIHVVSWARQFHFEVGQLDVPVNELSGGERARVIISRLVRRPADVLILDEPTNDLDIETLEALESSLEEFDGAVVLVSHDRYMLENLCTEFLGFDGSTTLTSFGSYSQWEREVMNDRAQNKAKAKLATSQPTPQGPSSSPPQPTRKKKLSYREQREFDEMEALILTAETEAEAWQTKVDDPRIASSAEELAEACRELTKARAKVQRLYDRWAELESMVE